MTRAHNAITFVLRNPQRLRSSVIIIARLSEEDAVKSESRSYRKVTLLKGSDEKKKRKLCNVAHILFAPCHKSSVSAKPSVKVVPCTSLICDCAE